MNRSIVFARWCQCAPIYICSLGPPESTCRTPAGLVQPFLHSVPIVYYGPPLSSLKLPLHKASLDHRLIHGALPPSESTTQTASRPVQPFLQGSRLRQTDYATPSVTIGRLYICGTTMQPKKIQQYLQCCITRKKHYTGTLEMFVLVLCLTQ